MSNGFSLKDIQIDTQYDSEDYYDEDPEYILNNFYRPCLSKSVSYDRIAGFFSSSTFSVISKGLMSFVLNKGKMRLITSPYISAEDKDAIIEGERTKDEVIEECLIDNIFSEGGELDEYSELLGWMVANNRLEVKIAIMYDVNGSLMDYNQMGNSALFHHKTGIFKDADDNIVSFSGSINETLSAWTVNGESFNTFCNWKLGQNEYILGHQKQFDSYWQEGKHNRTFVTTLPEAVKQKWTRDLPKSIEDLKAYNTFINQKHKEQSPDGNNIEDRPYQRDAVNNWASNNYKGLFDMATGTGKTKTALLAAKRLEKDLDGKIAITIVCPYLHLVQMWEEDVKQFGFNNYISGHSQSPDWKINFERKIRLFKKQQNCFVFITTINSFCSEYVQKWIDKISSKMLLIVDEVHRMGSKNYSKYLNESIPYRLGVSATIDRFRDLDGTNRILNYFGDRCITYTLERALRENQLTPYKYHPIVCYFTDDEYEKIVTINKKIDSLLKTDSLTNNKEIEQLRINGAKLIARMDDKLEKLVEIMKNYRDKHHMLIYCGATSVTSSESEIDEETGNSVESDRLINHVAKLLNERYGLQLRTFTCADNIENRKIIIEDFVNKHLQSILAIRCLDEGVNIPDIRYAFLLSSSEDPKEYIQRRGRILRIANNKPYAEIFDFLSFPKSFATKIIPTTNEQIELGIIMKELRRVHDFSKLSINPEESNAIVEQVSDIYKINVEAKLDG